MADQDGRAAEELGGHDDDRGRPVADFLVLEFRQVNQDLMEGRGREKEGETAAGRGRREG